MHFNECTSLHACSKWALNITLNSQGNILFSTHYSFLISKFKRKITIIKSFLGYLSFIRNTRSLQIEKFGLFPSILCPSIQRRCRASWGGATEPWTKFGIFKNLLLCFFLDEVKKQKVADHLEDDKYTCCACGGATYDITFTGKVIMDQVSGKLPTYPSPKPSFCPKWEESVNVGSGEG